MGDFETSFQDEVESTVEYHPARIVILTLDRYKFLRFWRFIPVRGQCLVGSLVGATASQNVTEAFTKVG